MMNVCALMERMQSRVSLCVGRCGWWPVSLGFHVRAASLRFMLVWRARCAAAGAKKRCFVFVLVVLRPGVLLALFCRPAFILNQSLFRCEGLHLTHVIGAVAMEGLPPWA